jgi:TolB-like protein/class 3 adenylate cyclase/Tfp pilus assembly protein PilF
MASTRRLTAILAADVASYSRLMGADEEGTHQRLRAHIAQLVDPKIREYKGRTVKSTGDGLLAEFASVVDAVRCAAEVQRGMIDRERMVAEAWRIRFRIGINLGDVIAEDDDIFGDGVNVAARLEALAEPGGICISRTVRDQIRDKLPYPFEDRGEQSVKNIARPVRVYALRPEAIADLPVSGAATAASHRPRRTAVAAVALAAIAALVIAAIAWWAWPVRKPSTPPTVAAATSVVPLAAPRLSIVVLPFANLSNDPAQQYFADGITEDLTTDLSRIPDMLVISRDSAFTYKDKPVNAKQIGRELGVRYVLEGSVQRSGNEVRVNAQLIDAATDTHLWAERFDRGIGDLFALQDEITGRIANTLNVELVTAEATRPNEHPDALDYIFRGRAAMSRPASRQNYAEAIGMYERALAFDPRSVEAQSLLANALTARVLDDMTGSAADDLARAGGLIAQAIAAAPNNPLVHFANGTLLRAQHRCDAAIAEYETVLASNRNWAGAIANIGRCKIYIGPIAEAIPLEEQAIRLDPRNPEIANTYFRIGQAHLLLSQTDEAIIWLEKSSSANPEFTGVHAFLASGYALKGDLERAAAELAEARRLSGNGGPSSIARSRADLYKYFEVPATRGLLEATYLAGLRKAGVPEK